MAEIVRGRLMAVLSPSEEWNPLHRSLAPRIFSFLLALGMIFGHSGCASMRRFQPDRDLQPCNDGFAETADGWRLGVRHYKPRYPDPGKEPVVLCHGLGLNGTFWTLTNNHLPEQLTEQGYDVFVVDLRGSGASHLKGTRGLLNGGLRETIIPEIASAEWSMDHQAIYDVPAILDYVQEITGHQQVNWIGHSLGGMLMFAFFDRSPDADRISNFVAMGSPACIAQSPEREQMLRANRGLQVLLRAFSTGRIARPLAFVRPPGLDRIDRFYYTAANVDRRTVDRFYGFTLEDPGPGALRQMALYLETGRLVSANGTHDYFDALPKINVPTLVVAGDGDILANLESNKLTFDFIGSADKTFLRFGKKEGHFADYGHCDLVWSRYAPSEIFPEVIDWLDERQPGVYASPQSSPQSQRTNLTQWTVQE